MFSPSDFIGSDDEGDEEESRFCVTFAQHVAQSQQVLWNQNILKFVLQLAVDAQTVH